MYKTFTLLLSVLRDKSEAAAEQLSSVLELPLVEGFMPVEFVTLLAIEILKGQCESEISKVRRTHLKFEDKLLDKLEELMMGSRELHRLR